MTESPRLAKRSDLDRFVATSAAAMNDDPMIRWPLPPDATLETVTLVTRPIVEMYMDVGSGWMLEAKPQNLPFYQSLGFTVIGEDDAPDGGPRIWFLRT